MPLLSLAQIASHATRLANLPAAPLSIVSEYINIAVGVLANTPGITLTEVETLAYASTSTGTDNARLGLPADYDRALGLKVAVPDSWSTATSRTTRWEPLVKNPPQHFDTVWVQSDTSGIPKEYAEYATWLELNPSPNSQYSLELRYMRKPSEMTASTATPPFDEQWHWALAIKTAELLAQGVSSDFTQERDNARRYANYVAQVRLDQGKKRADPEGMHMTRRGFGR